MSNAGFEITISYLRVLNLRLATGIILFPNKKEMPVIKMLAKIKDA